MYAKEVRGSIPGLTAKISEIGYLLLPSCIMAERLLKRRKYSKQPTNQRWIRPKKKYVCLRFADRPYFLAPTLNFFIALLLENYLNTLFLPSNVVFGVYYG